MALQRGVSLIHRGWHHDGGFCLAKFDEDGPYFADVLPYEHYTVVVVGIYSSTIIRRVLSLFGRTCDFKLCLCLLAFFCFSSQLAYQQCLKEDWL